MREWKIPVYPIEKGSILALLEKERILLNKYAKQYIRHPGFRTEEAGEIDVVLGSLSELGLPKGGRYQDIFTEARRRGLCPCRPSGGLFLRLFCRSQAQSKNNELSGAHRAPEGAVTVLSPFLEPANSFPKGLYLRNVGGALWLRGYLCDDAHLWSPEDVFALEKERVRPHQG